MTKYVVIKNTYFENKCKVKTKKKIEKKVFGKIYVVRFYEFGIEITEEDWRCYIFFTNEKFEIMPIPKKIFKKIFKAIKEMKNDIFFEFVEFFKHVGAYIVIQFNNEIIDTIESGDIYGFIDIVAKNKIIEGENPFIFEPFNPCIVS